MTTLEVLRAGRALIADKPNHVKGRMTDGHGRYCALGAAREASRIDARLRYDWQAYDEVCKALDAIARERHPIITRCSGKPPAAAVNDLRGHAAVLAVYDRAIAVEEAKAQEFDVPTTTEVVENAEPVCA